MKILVLDNYDSFTYNLVHIIRELDYAMDVFRNDQISIEAVGQYDKILLSPGPGIPDEAGIMKKVITTYAPTKSILGVCLGHQGIAECFGGKLLNLPHVLHGVTSTLQVLDPHDELFNGLPGEFTVTHYHSWVVEPNTLPNTLKVTSTNAQGLVLSLAHLQYDVRGVQFHPESIMTEHGKQMIQNWLSI
ncbi:MAG: anthranilate synthase component II [Flammeovirgaceae bacterium]